MMCNESTSRERGRGEQCVYFPSDRAKNISKNVMFSLYLTGFSKVCLFCFGRLKAKGWAKSPKEIMLLNISSNREARAN